VILHAIVWEEGTLLLIEATSKSADTWVVRAAIDAVEQWRYQPTLLDGRPVM
jgi:hypothetical protein